MPKKKAIVIDEGFQQIPRYGWMANGTRIKKLKDDLRFLKHRLNQYEMTFSKAKIEGRKDLQSIYANLIVSIKQTIIQTEMQLKTFKAKG